MLHKEGHPGISCTETSFYTKDIYIFISIYIYLYIYLYIHTRAHTQKQSLIGFLCSSKNSWQLLSVRPEKAIVLPAMPAANSPSQRQTLEFIWQVELDPA